MLKKTDCMNDLIRINLSSLYKAGFPSKLAKFSVSPVFWIMYLSCRKRLHFDHMLDSKISPTGLHNQLE